MKRLFLAAFLLAVVSFPSPGGEDASLVLRFIDVGCGDAILIEYPPGFYSLVDTGPPAAREKLLGCLREQGVEKLLYLIVTHPHSDHLGNAVAAAESFEPRFLRDNGQAIDRFDDYLTREMAAEYEREFRGKDNYRVLRASGAISWGDLTLDVLGPRDPAGPGDWNANSLVLMLRYGKFRALLAGDLNVAGEETLLKEGGPDLRAGLLKVGHHGAGDATGEDFLRAVSPRIAIVSVGENPWGYPDEENLSRLEKAGIRLHRTDRDGTIVLLCRKDGSVSGP